MCTESCLSSLKKVIFPCTHTKSPNANSGSSLSLIALFFQLQQNMTPVPSSTIERRNGMKRSARKIINDLTAHQDSILIKRFHRMINVFAV